MTLRYGELFAGAGGLSLGLKRAGLECAWHAEIDDSPRAVLRHRWPDTSLYGDVTQLNGAQLVDAHGPIDILTGGSPCQDLSIAGKRRGLAGDRSSLFHEQMRLWDETGADLCLWENVYGALSSNAGQDFAVVLGTFVGAAFAVPSDGWPSAGVVAGPSGVAAWRCLDCQWFGPPQRRLRVFVLGTRSGSIDPAQVLLEPEGVRGNPPTRREARQKIADSLTVGANQTCGFPGDGVAGDERSGLTTIAIQSDAMARSGDGAYRNPGVGDANAGEPMYTLHTSQQHAVFSFSENQRAEVRTASVVPSLSSAGGGKPGQGFPAVFAFHHTQDPISGPSAPCLGAEGMGVLAFNAKQDGTDADAIAPTLLGMPHDESHANGGGQVAIVQEPIVLNDQGGSVMNIEVDAFGCLRSQTHGNEQIILASGQANAEVSEGLSPSLTCLHEAPIIASVTGFGQYREIPPTLRASGGDNGAGSEALVIAGTLGAEHARKPGQQEAAANLIQISSGIPRRLTPRECERLMGWPDDWTLVPNDKGKPMSDAARYKMIGNGVASPVVQWIAGRMLNWIAAYDVGTVLGDSTSRPRAS